jgi:hypothetical protein
MKTHPNTVVAASEQPPSSPAGGDVAEPLDRPFILGFLVSYPGACNPTTTGTWDNMDGSDNT